MSAALGKSETDLISPAVAAGINKCTPTPSLGERTETQLKKKQENFKKHEILQVKLQVKCDPICKNVLASRKIIKFDSSSYLIFVCYPERFPLSECSTCS